MTDLAPVSQPELVMGIDDEMLVRRGQIHGPGVNGLTRLRVLYF